MLNNFSVSGGARGREGGRKARFGQLLCQIQVFNALDGQVGNDEMEILFWIESVKPNRRPAEGVGDQLVFDQI